MEKGHSDAIADMAEKLGNWELGIREIMGKGKGVR